jgi:predicted metal-dependent phosphoesterase TrpH
LSLKIDLHNHTARGSVDAVNDPDDLVELARERGLDGICITDHGRRYSEWAMDLRKRHAFLVIAGMEASSELGDLLIFGIEEYPKQLITCKAICDYVHREGGVVVAAHPFRWDLSPKPWIGPREKDLTLEKAVQKSYVRMVDALESANGWATPEDVEFTEKVAAFLGKCTTGGSDAHGMAEIGRCFTMFDADVSDEMSLVKAIRETHFYGVDQRRDEMKGPMQYYRGEFEASPVVRSAGFGLQNAGWVEE